MPQPITQLLQRASKIIDLQEAELLLSHVLKKPKEYIISHPETNVNFFASLKYKRLVKKRCKGLPIAYLIGHKEFFGLDFLVNKYTLIPRPDTEILIEQIKSQPTILVDVGTGSGCIPISILKNNQTNAYATDISKKALKIAKKNAKKHNVNITFLHGNLLEPVFDKIKEKENIIITANLPYLTEKQFLSEKSIQHEPKSALVAKENGLALYKELLQQIKNLNSKQIQVFLEIDPSQSNAIIAYIKELFPRAITEIKKDLSNYDRIVIVNI